MRRANNPFLAICAILALEACDARPPPAAPRGEAVSVAPAEYVSPPEPTRIGEGRAGPTVEGAAPANARVRLASPEGQAQFVQADSQGKWRTQFPGLSKPGVYGLSVTIGGRQIQGEGYLLVTPDQQGALLRAGAAALRLDTYGTPGLRSLDFDREGGAVVSASVTPGTAVLLKVDGAQVAEGKAGANGRVELAIPKPLRPGAHRLQIYADGASDTAVVRISTPAPLAQGPMRSQLTSAGLRVDWLTPGGGMQSTILLH